MVSNVNTGNQNPPFPGIGVDCFTELVYRYYKDGRRSISPGQNRPGNPYR